MGNFQNKSWRSTSNLRTYGNDESLPGQDVRFVRLDVAEMLHSRLPDVFKFLHERQRGENVNHRRTLASPTDGSTRRGADQKLRKTLQSLEVTTKPLTESNVDLQGLPGTDKFTTSCRGGGSSHH